MNPRLAFSLLAPLAFLAPGSASEPAAPWVEALQLVPGRHQLFLDDFDLGRLYRVERVIHSPRKYAGNPVIRADRPSDGTAVQLRDAPSWDPAERVWKAWYITQTDSGGAAFARSPDGIHWEKPILGRVDFQGDKRNNLVAVEGDPTNAIVHVLIDPEADPGSRYKAMVGWVDPRPAVSADGYVFHILEAPAVPSEDESHLNWDPEGRRYIFTVKHQGPFGRSVYLTLSRDFVHWTPEVLIFHADALDQVLGAFHIREVEANPRMWHPTINHPSEYRTEIYNMPVFPYEGLYIGLPTYFESSGFVPLPRGNQDGTNSVKLACSRDLRAWTKVGDRRHFIPISEMGQGGLDTGQILAASHPIRHGDELWFYYSGLDVRYRPGIGRVPDEYHGGVDLAILRLDGFVSFHGGRDGGFLETRPLRLRSGRLWVNAAAGAGRIEAEIVDRDGRAALPGWGRAESTAVTSDRIRTEIGWRGHSDFRELAGRDFRIRFYLTDADLYSFWID